MTPRGTRDLGPTRGGGGSGDPPGSAGPWGTGGWGVPLLTAPHWIKPAEAIDFNRTVSSAALEQGNTPTTPAGLQTTIPSGNHAVIRSIVLSVDQTVSTTDIRWSFRQDRSPIQGWDDLTVFPIASSAVSKTFEPEETFIFIPDGGVISVEINVVDAGGPYDVGTDYHGWFFPKQLWTAWQETLRR